MSDRGLDIVIGACIMAIVGMLACAVVGSCLYNSGRRDGYGRAMYEQKNPEQPHEYVSVSDDLGNTSWKKASK